MKRVLIFYIVGFVATWLGFLIVKELAPPSSPLKLVQKSANVSTPRTLFQPTNGLPLVDTKPEYDWVSKDGSATMHLSFNAYTMSLNGHFAEAFTYLLSLPPTLNRDRWVAALLGYWAEKDAPKAGQALLEWHDAHRESWRDAAQKICCQWWKQSPEATKAFIKENNLPDACWWAIMSRLGPMQATSLWPEMRENAFKWDIFSSIVNEGLRLNPELLAKWISQQHLPADKVGEALRRGYGWQFTRDSSMPIPTDAETLFNLKLFLENVNEPTVSEFVAEQYLNLLAKASPSDLPAATLALAEVLPSVAEKSLLAVTAQHSALFEKTLTAQDLAMLPKSVSEKIFREISTRSSSEAAQWAFEHERLEFANLAVFAFADFDFDAASTWTEGLPDGEFREKAISSLCSDALNKRNWAAANKWLAQIKDTKIAETYRKRLNKGN